MNDPHVQDLRYRLTTDLSVSYNEPKPIVWSTAEFDGELKDGKLTLKMKKHYPTADSAQNAVRDMLKSWEIYTELQIGSGNLGFEYESSSIVDRNPPPPGGPIVVRLEPLRASATLGTVTVHVAKKEYPLPPSKFATSSLVEAMWHRYSEQLENREPLTSMGYFCLSALQSDAGGRKKASTKYQIHMDVLDTLGRLTSEVGDSATARKIDRRSTLQPHTKVEIQWIVAAVKKLITRAGEVAANPSGPHAMITMKDLLAI